MENIGLFETGEGPEQGDNAPSDTVSLDQLVSNLFSQLQDFEEDLFHWGHPPELRQPPQHEAAHNSGDIQLQTVDQKDVSAQIQAEDLHAEGEAACSSLDQPISELEVLRERDEAFQHQLKEFENVKEENSCLVQINQRLELELQQVTEKSQQSQSEQTEAYRRLRDLQLSQEKDLQQKCDELQRLQQRLEEQETLQQRLEQEKLQQRLEQEKLQQRLEQEKLQQRLEEQERLQQRLEQEKLQQRLEEQERLCQSLERQISERESERTNIDLLEQKLEEFDGLKQDYCGLVTYCQSLQTDLDQTKDKLLQSEFVRQDLLLSHQKALKEHREQLQRVKQRMEEQKEAHSCLEQQDSEREIQNRKIEALTRELEDFEEVKGEYSRLVSYCKSLEKDLEEAKRCINQLSQEQLLEQKTINKSSEREMIERLKRELEDFEDVKGEYSRLVSLCKRLEKDLEDANRCINQLRQELVLEKESSQQVAVHKSSEREMRERIERLKSELEDFEEVKGEYSQLVSHCKRLEKDLEEAKRCINSNQLPTDLLLEKESLKQVAVDKSSEKERIERLKRELEDFEEVKGEYSRLVSLCKRLEKDLEEAKKNSLVVVAEPVSEAETCVDTRESVSEEKVQSQPSDEHQHSCVRKTLNVFGQSSRERPTPKNSQHECEELRRLNGSVKNLTQFFGPENKTEEEKQAQGSDLNRTSAKRGEKVAALMKMFES
uniref:Uncharacterized protein n=1 Tax=Knipowitschia caucasica TaxID=637954 RepID=A0AAV2M9W9_KNICA